jgi:activator of HSP90 ATPase
MAASAWHWRTLGVSQWSTQWLTDQLTGLESDGIRVTKVSSVDGDTELGSRKGKCVSSRAYAPPAPR